MERREKMHLKLAITLLGSALFSWLAVSAAFATAPQMNVQPSQLIGGQQQSSGSTLNLSAAVTSTITNTKTTTGTLPPGEQKIAEAIAARFGVSLSEVLTVHDQIHGWGEVFMVFLLSQKTGKTPGQILTMRKSEGWGKLFMDLGLHPGLKGDNLGGAIIGRPTPTTAPPAFSPNSKEKGKKSSESNDENKECSNSTGNDNEDECAKPNPLNLFNRPHHGNGKGR
jgi:hypothetical protein